MEPTQIFMEILDMKCQSLYCAPLHILQFILPCFISSLFFYVTHYSMIIYFLKVPLINEDGICIKYYLSMEENIVWHGT